MKKKRLILHIGQGKTGSTALQYFFSKYHDELKKNNIDYPYPESTSVLNTKSCVGNLIKILFEKKVRKQKITTKQIPVFADIWKDEYVILIKEITENSTCDTVIFSGEAICSLDKIAFEKMKNFLEEFFDVEFVLFMRDPYELLYSSWKQVLKVNFILENFKTFITERILGHTRSNGYEIVELKSINIKIINYDTYKNELAKKFIEVTNLNFEIPSDYESRILFNRSFTDSEASIQLLINRQFKNSRFPFLFRTLLLERDAPPKNLSNQFYDEEVHTIILNHLKKRLISVNKIIYGEPISLEVKKINVSGRRIIEEADVEVLASALSYIKQSHIRKMNLSESMSHFYKCIRKRNIPFSFDPEAYLIINQDVKDSGMDPYEHFTQYGIYEKRPYKFL